MRFATKRITIFGIFAFAAFFMVLAVSCNQDKCKNVICANNGICNAGACTCPAGYEGPTCSTLTYQQYTGNWTVFEKGSTTNAANYVITIQPADNIAQVGIVNFNNYFTSLIIANVSGDSIVIPTQRANGKVVFGSGYIYSTNTYYQYDAISMAYEVVDSATGTVDDYGYYSSLDGSNPSAWNK